MTIDQEHVTESRENSAEEAEYRSITPWAIIALALGVASALSFAAPLLLALPILGIAAAAIALRQIAAEGSELTGRRAALWGLGLSIAFGVGAVSEKLTTNWRLESDATEFAMLWFDQLRQRRPQLAHQLTLEPPQRRLSGDLLEYYHSQPEARAELETFTGDTAIRTILEQGERAVMHQYTSEVAGKDSRGRLLVGQVYDITFDNEVTEKPLRMTMLLRRSKDYDTKAPRWQIYRFKGSVKPPA